MLKAVSLHGKVGIAGYDHRMRRYSHRRNGFAPSPNVLVFPLFGKDFALFVITTSCYLYTNDHLGW